MSVPVVHRPPLTLQAKKEEIAEYRRILKAYRGRWYDSGRRHLAMLEDQLEEMERCVRGTGKQEG